MNKYNPDIHHRRSIRLRGYDYSQEGLYFVTICTQHRKYLFGEIANGKMRLNEIGRIVEKCWLAIPQHYPDTALHNHIVMPNHFHGIIEITKSFDVNNVNNGNIGVGSACLENNDAPVGANNNSPQNSPQNSLPRPNGTSHTIGAIVRGFKIGTTKNIGYSVWQRNYHEHIIRNHADHARIADYIAGNPTNWRADSLYNP